MSQKHEERRPRPPTLKPVSPKVHDSEILDELDELLDEIDAVLESNALEVTRTFRQKGGQ